MFSCRAYQDDSHGQIGPNFENYFLKFKFNIGNNKKFANISKFDALLSTLYVQCYLVSVDIFCWMHNCHSFVFYRFQFSNLYPFGSRLVTIHLFSSIFYSPTSTSLDLVVKLVHYIGFWLCISKLMGLCTHANQLLELMEFCTHALDFLCLKFILKEQWLQSWW